MKKLLMIALAIGGCYSIANAQAAVSNSNPFTFGIRAGINFQNFNGEDAAGRRLDNKLTTGFHAGVNAEMLIAEDFFLQPGVLYSVKGAKAKNSDTRVSLGYLEIPVNLVYKPILGSGNLLLGFGPYLGIGLNGKVTTSGVSTDVEFRNEVTSGSSIMPTYKRLDAGASFLFGYEFSNRISAQLNAQLGLLNVNPKIAGVDDQSRVRNTGFGVSVGYRF